MAEYDVEINMDRECQRCHRQGATTAGYCLTCSADLVLDGKSYEVKTRKPGYGWAEASPEVIHLAEDLIALHHPTLRSARVGFLFREEAPESKGRSTWCKAQKVADNIRAYVDLDFIVWIAEDVWNRLSSERRAALIDHALCHCWIGPNGPTLIQPDIVEFTQVIERHGFWTQELYRVQRIAEREAEQLAMFPDPEPEPAGAVVAVQPGQLSMLDMKLNEQEASS